jgi:hypothetical protein
VCVFGHHCLVDGGPDRISPFANDLGPGLSHRGVVTCGAVAGHGYTELATENVGNDALAGSVVEKVDEIAQDQDDLSAADHLLERVEGTMDVGDDEQFQL